MAASTVATIKKGGAREGERAAIEKRKSNSSVVLRGFTTFSASPSTCCTHKPTLRTYNKSKRHLGNFFVPFIVFLAFSVILWMNCDEHCCDKLGIVL